MDKDEWRGMGVLLFWGNLLGVMASFLVGTLFVALASRDIAMIILGFGFYGLSMGCLVMVSVIAYVLWEEE